MIAKCKFSTRLRVYFLVCTFYFTRSTSHRNLPFKEKGGAKSVFGERFKKPLAIGHQYYGSQHVS